MQNLKTVPVNVLAILLSVLLGACTFETINEAPSDEGAPDQCAEVDDMSGQTRWGQKRTIGPAWIENSPQVLFTLDMRRCQPPILIPHVVNVALGVDFKGPVNGAAQFRYSVKAGTGGANREWLVDARPLQQVSLSADWLEVSLLTQRFYVDGDYQNPAVSVDGSAFAAVGNTSTSSATYTQRIANLTSGIGPQWWIGPAQPLGQIPAGATGFKLIGATSGGQSPFIAGVSIALMAGVQTAAFYVGTDLKDLALSDGFIPLPGGVDSLQVYNSSGGTLNGVGIQWVLDL
jgi:hypothetical protein